MGRLKRRRIRTNNNKPKKPTNYGKVKETVWFLGLEAKRELDKALEGLYHAQNKNTVGVDVKGVKHFLDYDEWKLEQEWYGTRRDR